jgi:MoaA/NifB/PqqE/SkfB family radical SAM enzyme
MSQIRKVLSATLFRYRRYLWIPGKKFPWSRDLLQGIFRRYIISGRKNASLTPSAGPLLCELNISAACNLSCIFCEIHHYYAKVRNNQGIIHPNYVNRHILERMDDLMSKTLYLSFGNGIGEPLRNPHFCGMIKYLADVHPHIRISMTTNATLLHESIADAILQGNNFHSVCCSMSGGNPETYKMLHGDHYESMRENLKRFIEKRNALKRTNPLVMVNFILSRLNADSLPSLIRNSPAIGIDGIHLIHYLQVRNLLTNDVSYYRTPEEADRILLQSYQLAQDIGMPIIPGKPELLSESVDNSPDPGDSPCDKPWNILQISPCQECENRHYIGVCGRIQLLRVDLTRWGDTYTFPDIWHHPVFQYLRMTVNSEESNSICKFCKSQERMNLRRKNPVEYFLRREEAVRNFFSSFSSYFPEVQTVPGIELLDENPYFAEEIREKCTSYENYPLSGDLIDEPRNKS